MNSDVIPKQNGVHFMFLFQLVPGFNKLPYYYTTFVDVVPYKIFRNYKQCVAWCIYRQKSNIRRECVALLINSWIFSNFFITFLCKITTTAGLTRLIDALYTHEYTHEYTYILTSVGSYKISKLVVSYLVNRIQI